MDSLSLEMKIKLLNEKINLIAHRVDEILKILKDLQL